MRRFTSHSTQQSSDTHNGEVGEASQGAIVGDSLAPTTRISTSSPDGLGSQQSTFPPTLRLETSRSSAGRSSSGTPSPSRHFTKLLDNLQKVQVRVPLTTEGQPRVPESSDFPSHTSYTIVEPLIDRPLEHCIVLLHHEGGDEQSLKDLARRLHKQLPECLFLLLRGLEAVPPGNCGYHWTHSDDGEGESFFRSTRWLLENIVLKVLIEQCHFRPRNIVILGHDQGGVVALAAAALWHAVELGGVISFGGSLPTYMQSRSSDKAETPVLIVKGQREPNDPQAVQFLRANFALVDTEGRSRCDEQIPTGKMEDELQPLLDFFVHRLKQEEWTKQTVISFDGGGIRGYASLLILRAIMEKIAQEERRQDGNIESSFAPGIYKPTKPGTDPLNDTGDAIHPDPSEHSNRLSIVPTECRDLPDSSKFLPCHYFTYFAGTSTGGLITIMLQRFRMNVDDCIKEYENLGDKVFGHPRPTAFGLPWPKFDSKILENVIQDVTRRHGEQVPYEDMNYSMERSDDDMCRCMVLAISDQGEASKAFAFRTYQTPPPDPKGLSRSATISQQSRGYGEPFRLPVWKVARATSAAPKFFAPIRIRSGDGKKWITFKDGGFGCNNPSREMYQDIRYKHGEGSVSLFVSIGTGETSLKHDSTRSHLRDMFSNVRIATKLPVQTGPAHDDMNELSSKKDGSGFPYYRFDGGRKLGDIAMDEWKSHKMASIRRKPGDPGHKTLQKISAATDEYLQKNDVQKELEEIAKVLVRRRRLRVRDASEWERFASFTYYRCDISRDHKPCEKVRMRTADKFREHLRKDHHFELVNYRAIEWQVRQSRHYGWVYH